MNTEWLRKLQKKILQKKKTKKRKNGYSLFLIKLSDWNLFRTNQIYSDSFRNLYPGQSELTRINPRFFNPNQNSIGMNLNKVLNPNESEVRMI